MRIALVCPGRGSYTERTLGSLEAGHPLVARAEAARERAGLEPLLALDRARRFEPARHLRPANVSALIFLKSVLDAERALDGRVLTCVAGNSMGWYTALAVAGALSFDDAFELVQEMALLQEEGASGGQLVYPIAGDDWRRLPEREEAIARALEGSAGEAFPSIHLGGYEVLAGSSAGIAHLVASLPPIEQGRARYPLRLVQHGPYHTPLAASVAEAARARLGALDFRRPHATLVDGRGLRQTPWSADPAELRAYTLGAQVTTPYDFTTSLRVVLREHAPERLVLPGHGNTLGGPCGQVLVAEGWRGITTRADFDRVQAGAEPMVESLGR